MSQTAKRMGKPTSPQLTFEKTNMIAMTLPRLLNQRLLDTKDQYQS